MRIILVIVILAAVGFFAWNYLQTPEAAPEAETETRASGINDATDAIKDAVN